MECSDLAKFIGSTVCDFTSVSIGNVYGSFHLP